MRYWNLKNSLLFILCILVLGVFSCASPEAPLPPTTTSSISGDQKTPDLLPPSSTVSNPDDNAHSLVISLLGQNKELPANSRGQLTTDVQVESEDGLLSLFIESGTSFQDKDGKPVFSVNIKARTGSLLTPENTSIVGTPYEFTPNGITCSRPLRLILKYNPDSLPPNVEEKDVYVACFGDGRWNRVGSKPKDTEGHFTEVQIDHFCWYTILAPLPSNPAAISPPDFPVVSNKVDLLYFHPAGRCATCKYFEERIGYVMATYFQKEMESGRLTLTLYDYLDKANADLVKKYQVVGSQLFIRTTINGAENIRSVWEIYQWGWNADAFATGLRAIIQESLEGEK